MSNATLLAMMMGLAQAPAGPVPATVHAFSAVSTPVSNIQQGTALSAYGIKDSVTGDLVFWSYTANNTNPTALYTSQNNGQTWAQVATDATNPVSDWSKPMGMVQDSSGAVHAITFSQPLGYPGYGRLTLTRASGHVTGYTWAVAPFALPAHSTGAENTRGTIYDVTLGGVETIVYVFSSSVGATDLKVYAARATSLTPSSTSSFVGLDGTGSDSTLLDVTEASGTRNGSTHQCGLAQVGSTEDLYMFVGPFDEDQAQAPGGTVSNDDLWFRQLPKSAGVWTVGSSSSLGTDVCAAATGVPIPNILGVYSTSSGAWVMYSSGSTGINFGSVNSAGTLTAVAVTSPLSTASRAAYGAFTVGTSGDIWTIFNTYGPYSSLTPTGKLAHWNGTTWETSTTDTSAAACIGMISFSGWARGCATVRIEGSPTDATVVGTLSGASVFNP